LSFDENSKYKWLVFFTLSVTYFFIFSQRTAPGLITDQLMKQFQMTASTLGLLTGFQYIAYMSLQIPLGIWADRFGPYLFLLMGTLLDGVGTILYSVSPNEWILMSTRVLVGIGDAMIWINIVLVLSQWFRADEFASLLGWTGMSGSLGAILTSVPLTFWIAHQGWRVPFFCLGLILCGCAAMIYLVMMTGTKRHTAPYQLKMNQPVQELKPKNKGVFRKLLHSRQAWATFLCHFGLVGTYIGFIGSWAVPYGMVVYGFHRTTASELVTIGLIGALLGGPITGYISDKWGSRKQPYVLIHFITFLSWLTLCLWEAKPPIAVLLILFFLIGFGNGASMLTFAVVRQSFPKTEVGVASGFANTGGFLSAVTLPTLFGLVLDHFGGAHSLGAHAAGGGYQFGLLVPTLFSLIGMIGSIVILEKKQTPKRKMKTSVLAGM
jgi:MFS family permease